MAMSPETRPQVEPNGVNPIEEARRAFNNELLGKEYHPGVLLTRTLQLHQALLRSDLPPEIIYHESSVIADQAAQRAQLFDDIATAEPLREMRRSFELTHEIFSPKLQAAQTTEAPQPTRTETLPPMTSAKGREAPLQTQRRPAQTQAAPSTPAVTSAEAFGEGQQEETFGSFLRQKRTEANLSQAKLAETAGNMTNLVISALERGLQKTFDETKAHQIVSALGLSPEDTEKYMELYRKQFGTPPETSQK